MVGRKEDIETQQAHIKAIIGALLLQYLTFAVFYIYEAMNYAELHKYETVEQEETRAEQYKEKELQVIEENLENKEEAKVIDAEQELQKDFANLDQIDDGTKKKDETDAEEALKRIKDRPIVVRVTEGYQKSQLWFVLAVMLAIFKGAIGITVLMAYACFLGRLMQVAGLFLNKPWMAYSGYVVATGSTFVIFATAFFTD